jgi:hypothetical protein
MPTWDGTIEEHEYAPLARFVRTLASARTASVASGEPSERN